MKSIMQKEKKCYICGRKNSLDEHHVFGGNPNRKLSEKYGLKVWLCNDFTPTRCHKEAHEGEHSKTIMESLHKEGQKAFEETHGNREDFARIFGRNYL
ncbi:hypothetical protein D3Z38_18910 [Clostridiales bacterium]|nr:hypothetical protein [Clostridiales bacterium]